MTAYHHVASVTVRSQLWFPDSGIGVKHVGWQHDTERAILVVGISSERRCGFQEECPDDPPSWRDSLLPPRLSPGGGRPASSGPSRALRVRKVLRSAVPHSPMLSCL